MITMVGQGCTFMKQSTMPEITQKTELNVYQNSYLDIFGHEISPLMKYTFDGD